MDTLSEDSKPYSLAINALRKSISDTEKFGALFVVCNVLKDKHLSCEQNQRLFKSIESDFLCRLLLSDGRSTEIPDGCQQYIYQSIGVSIITSFLKRITDYIDSKTWIQLLCSMAVVLKQLKGKDKELDETESQMMSDIIDCFECFFSSNSVKEIDFQSMNRLFETKFSQFLIEIYSKDKFNEYKVSINHLLAKIGITIEWSVFDCISFDEFMSCIANDFKVSQSIHKFELCQPLNAILIKNQKYFVNQTNNASIGLITDTIFEILRNKLNPNLRDPVIKMSATLTEIFEGFKWIHWPNPWNERNSKHFLLLLRLSCIEIAVNYESENVDMSCVANSFVILEHSVITLANDSEEMDLLKHLTPEEIYDMLTAIKDTMSVIIRHLMRFDEQITQIDCESDVCVSILAAIRVLCVWMTEETESLREEIADILPFILKVFRKTYENRFSINKPIISALISFSENDSLKTILLNENLIEFLDMILIKEPNDSLVENLKDLLQN